MNLYVRVGVLYRNQRNNGFYFHALCGFQGGNAGIPGLDMTVPETPDHSENRQENPQQVASKYSAMSITPSSTVSSRI